MASLFDRQESLQERTAQLNEVFEALATECKLAAEIPSDFRSLVGAWEHFCEASLRMAELKREENERNLNDEQLMFTKERAKLKERRRRLQMKEVALEVKEQELHRPLERFVSLYTANLTEMEFALQEAKQRRMHKETELMKQMLRVDKEIEEAMDGNSPRAMPRLLLEGLGNRSACSSVPISIESRDIVSNRSAFDSAFEPGGDSSYRSHVPRPPTKAPPKVKFQHRIKEADSPRAEPKTSVNHSFNSDSQAFDSLVDHLKSHDFSCDDSKWDSENELGGTATSLELRHVLEKAVEFNFDDPVRSIQEVLARVKEARKHRDVPSAYNV